MKKSSPAYVLIFMVIITLVCGTAIALVQSSMKDTLTANSRLSRNRTIAAAFELTTSRQNAEAFDTLLSGNLEIDTLRGKGDPIEYFTATDGRIGFIFSGMGFWDYITGIMVLSSDLSRISTLRIIDQKETPGLGARITEESFTSQFHNFPLRSGAQRFTFGEAAAEDGKTIDALTGATQTSIALERIINSELFRFEQLYTDRTATKPATQHGE